MKQPIYRPGKMIAGKYRIDKAIARGGCSIVYRGTHVDMNRELALKIMSLVNGRVDPAWQARFKREASLSSQLRHPNTITIFDYGEADGIFYIAMEWVEGLSLRNLIREEGPVEPLRAAQITVQILKSLAEAHRQNILHRDMKPSNIMITNDVDGEEMVKVLDFGLAKAQLGDDPKDSLKLTRDGDFIGTPRYASPEQLKGLKLTRAADIYGVGMVMWEMLAGEPAVPSVDYGTCVQHHLGPQAWKLPEGISPPGLATIVETALAKSQDTRYSSCEEMLKPLKQWIHDYQHPPAPEPEPEPEPVPEPAFDLDFESEPRSTLDFYESEPTLQKPSEPNLASQSDPFDVLGDLTSDPLADLSDPLSDLDDLEMGEAPFELDDLPPIDLDAPRMSTTASLRLKQTSGSHPKVAPMRISPPAGQTSISHLKSHELELDKPVKKSTRSNTNPYKSVDTSPGLPPLEPDTQDSLMPWLIALGLVVGLGMLGIFVIQNKNKQTIEDEKTTGDQVLESILDENKKQYSTTPSKKTTTPNPAIRENPSAKSLLMELRATGWSYASGINKTTLGSAKQTELKLKKGDHLVSATLYECEDAEIAHELVGSTKSGMEVVRVGLVVVRISATRMGSRAGVDSIMSNLIDIRKRHETQKP